MPPVRVLLIAADPLSRAGLAALLAEEDDLDIIGQVENTAQWDATLAAFRPEVVLWDLGWEESSLDWELINDFGPPLVFLVPGDSPPPHLLSPGVKGLLSRSAPPSQVAAGLLSAVNDLFVLSPEFAGIISPPQGKLPGERDPFQQTDPLTPRETEVLALLADGLTNKAIGSRLGISPHTVKFHITGILNKLDAQSRAEAVAIATRAGLLPI